MAFKRHQIDLAYRKLKSYVYYDNFSLVLRQQIAEFESGKDFDDRLDNLVKYLNAPVKNKKYFNELLENISCSAVPKSYSRDSFSFGENIISNNFTNSNYLLKKVNYFFEGPIELHLISVLWILHEGYVLHKWKERTK
ncbi:hypothetical protein SAMN02927921_04125 [Sinomicrobium oceani]|uniref:Uncharacterized protein n=1 Tax=Sinomicrobium oceani TaxID=1150368 RepID=A0A1K1RWR4_9FLAO|nr:hypothetical protein [Sinomicrobium oceani]SFW76505.1 hypothetical protein SAMN02927921_04125 [Sinomicrobium oceani]